MIPRFFDIPFDDINSIILEYVVKSKPIPEELVNLENPIMAHDNSLNAGCRLYFSGTEEGALISTTVVASVADGDVRIHSIDQRWEVDDKYLHIESTINPDCNLFWYSEEEEVNGFSTGRYCATSVDHKTCLHKRLEMIRRVGRLNESKAMDIALAIL